MLIEGVHQYQKCRCKIDQQCWLGEKLDWYQNHVMYMGARVEMWFGWEVEASKAI